MGKQELLTFLTSVRSNMPAATNWQPTVAHAAPAMPIARGPRTSTASPTTLTTDARSVASVGLAESLAPRHEACADMRTSAAGKDSARIRTYVSHEAHSVVVAAAAAALPPVRVAALASAAGSATRLMIGPIDSERPRATTQPMANAQTTETVAARLAPSLSPPPKVVETALVVPTLMKTISPVSASQMAHAGPSAASCTEETCPTTAVSMSERSVGIRYMGIAQTVNLSSSRKDGAARVVACIATSSARRGGTVGCSSLGRAVTRAVSRDNG